MKRAFVIAVASVLVLAGTVVHAQRQPKQKTFYIQWSVKQPMKMQDWSGHAEVDKGRVVSVLNDSGTVDKVHEDKSWTIVYGRSLASAPNTRPGPKGLWLTVEAPADAQVTVVTKGGTFAFKVNEVDRVGQAGIERLEGNVTIRQVAQEGRGGGRRTQRAAPTPVTELEGAVAGEIPAERFTDPEKQSDWPAIAATPQGALWAAYIEWNGADADRVLVKRRARDGTWGEAIALDDGCWDHYWPAVAARGEDALVVWSGQSDGNFELYEARISADGKASRPQRLTNAPHSDFNARMASDSQGNVTLVWQSFRNGTSDIYARRLRGDRWGKEIRISPSKANDWEPAVALDSSGTAWIVWDGYEAGNYDVFLRRLRGGEKGRIVAVTTETTAQFHPTVAVDGQDRVWVAWDDGGENWGKDNSRSSRMPGSQGLHFSRSLGVRVYSGGRLQEPEADLADIMVGRFQRYAELPHLAFDGAGTLWLVFRHWTITKPTEMYDFYATRLTSEGWATPWILAQSTGDNSRHVSVAKGADGRLALAYPADCRAPDNLPTDQIHSLIFGGYLAWLPQERSGAVALRPVDVPPAAEAPAPTLRYLKRLRDKTYTLVWGDCHRHTDIRGHSAVDASILDSYRYNMDAAPLGFAGMGDHNEVFGGRWPDGLRDYSWWWTQKAADLMNHPPTFVGVYSYEHSLATPAGHRNIIFLRRGAPLRMADRQGDSPDNLPPNLWKWIEGNVLTQPGQRCVIVPHTFAAGPLAEWNWPNPPFDGLLEIYQGCRGSYEAWNLPNDEKRGPTQTDKQGHFARDALAKGNRYGFVSFSDHQSTHNSFAGVWVEEVSREGILDALLAKRTYAASDEIILDVTADGHMVGEEFTAPTDQPPVIKVEIQAPDLIRRVDVIKNGAYAYTHEPGAKQFSFSFRDQDAEEGLTYYYVRVLQRDPEAPEGDPEMAWASPFFVNYE
ncbi:MAG: hypothetical protein ACE5R4_12445 [Armatimonadota bacterium]